MDHVPIDLAGQEADATTLELRSRGPWPLHKSPSVAIVGARCPTPYGEAVTERLAQDLAHRGVLIVGGLSRGIEAVAHQTALDAGGRTVAVLGTGVDVVYPAAHAELAERILSSGGTLLSAFPDGTRPRAANFRRRNWTMAALVDVVVVVEAPAGSVALTTAEAALALDKTVLAVPGSVFSPLSVGCHQLIRDGAALVQNTTDILSALAVHRPTDASLNSEDIRARLLNARTIRDDKRRQMLDAESRPHGAAGRDADGRTPAEAYQFWNGVVATYDYMEQTLNRREGRS
jgi:DNA protecting protein DprA